MYFIQLPVKNKFSEKTHNKERLLREEGGALLIYSNPLFQQMKRKSHDQAYVTQVCYSD